jgi:hypothetical protein
MMSRQDERMAETAWPPRPWPEEQLRRDAGTSLDALNAAQLDVASRRAAYRESFDEAILLFGELMRSSNYLLDLAGSSFESSKDQQLRRELDYMKFYFKTAPDPSWSPQNCEIPPYNAATGAWHCRSAHRHETYSLLPRACEPGREATSVACSHQSLAHRP